MMSLRKGVVRFVILAVYLFFANSQQLPTFNLFPTGRGDLYFAIVFWGVIAFGIMMFLEKKT